MGIPERLELAGEMAKYGISGIEAPDPSEVNPGNLWDWFEGALADCRTAARADPPLPPQPLRAARNCFTSASEGIPFCPPARVALMAAAAEAILILSATSMPRPRQAA